MREDGSSSRMLMGTHTVTESFIDNSPDASSHPLIFFCKQGEALSDHRTYRIYVFWTILQELGFRELSWISAQVWCMACSWLGIFRLHF